MGDLGGYWNTTGATKTFTHPLEESWLPDTPGTVLDYGCGYGRLCGLLADKGFTDITGVDISATMIGRARQERPDLRFHVLDDPPYTGLRSSSVDVVLLFAVLTCVPDSPAQQALIAEIERVLAPGGLLYVSDLLIADDERNWQRYSRYRGDLPIGTFITDDGATCRHHDPAYLADLLSGFATVRQRTFDAETMNGNRSPAIQILVRKAFAAQAERSSDAR